MAREKRHDEIYCRSCGSPIKKKAEICPECGVANEYREETAGASDGAAAAGGGGREPAAATSRSGHQGSTGGGSAPHDPAAYTTTVSDNWRYGVAASVGLWVLGFAMPEGSSIAGLFFLTAWALMPVSVYYDRQWLRATTDWNPDLSLWVVLSLVPLVNVVAGAVYLVRRRDATQVSAPTADATGASTGGDPLERLRERYSRGELTDAEFEAKVEKLVGTEDREAADIAIDATGSGDPVEADAGDAR